jgi:hypothetical protein
MWRRGGRVEKGGVERMSGEEVREEPKRRDEEME